MTVAKFKSHPRVKRSRRAEPPSRLAVYDGRTYLGFVRPTDCGTGFLAFDHRGTQIGGRHLGLKAAIAAVPSRRGGA
jgi:hypothetical protein